MVRSVLSVIAGYAIVAVATVLSLVLLARLAPGAFPDLTAPQPAPPAAWALGLLLGLGAAFMVVGGWVTGSIGRRAPLAHAAALGAVLLVLGLLTLAGGADGPVPAWYRIAGAALGLPAALLGGWMVARKSAVPGTAS